jgi:hypothetical protein
MKRTFKEEPMDDLDLLRGLGTDLVVPEKDTVAHARHNLLLATNKSARLHQARRRKTRWLVGVPAVAALVVAILVMQSALPSKQGGPLPAAAIVLDQLANTASQQPADGPAGPGQYWYAKVQGFTLNQATPSTGTYFYGVSTTEEQWKGTDRSGKIGDSGSTVTFPTSEDRAAWVAAGSPALGGTPGWSTFKPGDYVAPTDLSGLPSDPAALLALIRQREIEGGPPGDKETLAIIFDLLHYGYAPPEVRAGLFQAIAMLDGVTNVGPMDDPLGRPGVGLATTSPQGLTMDIIIFDPQTSVLLAEESKVLAQQDPCTQFGGCPPVGTLKSWSAYVASGVVDSLDQRL